jgi:hypothetical protein
VQRIGLRDPRRIKLYILRDGLPAFLRREPRNPLRKAYYSDETLMGAWLMARAISYREELKKQQGEQEERKRDRSANKRKI